MTLLVSPSQDKRFKACPRKTAWQLTGVKPKPDPVPRANALGDRGHKIAEEWLTRAIPPNTQEPFTYYRPARQPGRNVLEFPHGLEEEITAYPGAMVAEGLHHLPAPKSEGLHVEATIQHGHFKSRADYVLTGGEIPIIGDHKFVRDLGYALSNERGALNSMGEPCYLGEDPQFVIQAEGMFRHFPKATAVAGTWHYYQTRAKGGRFPIRRVHLRVVRDEIAEPLREIEARAALILRIYELRSRLDPRSLPANTQSCFAFGRACEYAENCNLTDQERFIAEMENGSTPIDPRVSAILDQIANGSRGPAASMGAPPSVPSAPPAPPSVPSAPETVTERLIHGLPESQWRALAPEEQRVVIAAAGLGLSGPDPINPPEAPLNDGQSGPAAPAKRVEGVIIPPGGLEAMDRDALKALAVERGILTTSSRLGRPAILDLILKAQSAPATIVADRPIHAGELVTIPSPMERAAAQIDASRRSDDLVRQILDRINAARRELQAAEEALHTALGI